jgi:hypothetical protein
MPPPWQPPSAPRPRAKAVPAPQIHLFVSNASAAPIAHVVQPADLWKAVRPPVFGYIALEIASAFFPMVIPYTTPALILAVIWAVVRIVKLVGGSDAWQKAGRQIAEEMKKQQERKKGG